jgi:hypothetical protein
MVDLSQAIMSAKGRAFTSIRGTLKSRKRFPRTPSVDRGTNKESNNNKNKARSRTQRDMLQVFELDRDVYSGLKIKKIKHSQRTWPRFVPGFLPGP